MSKKFVLSFMLFSFLSSGFTSWAQEDSSKVNSDTKVKYTEGKKLDFEALLIEGEAKKPELSVITGNSGDKDLGLLKLRENFLDFVADDAGENVK